MPKREQGEPYYRVSLDEAGEMHEDGESVVVDVRRDDEYEAGHVTGAVFMPVDDVLARIDELPVDKNLLFICAQGVRSGLACEDGRSDGVRHGEAVQHRGRHGRVDRARPSGQLRLRRIGLADSPPGFDGRVRPKPPGAPGDVLVVGSVAYDTVETAAGRREDALGGSGAYFSVAGSYFAAIGLVAVVGDDFDPAHTELLQSHGVDLSGLDRKPGKTFRWSGVYGAEDVNTRDTLDTQLNVFADFAPKLSEAHRRRSYLFLANIDPELQMSVLDQMAERPRLVALDTMNFWIDGRGDALRNRRRECRRALHGRVGDAELLRRAEPACGCPSRH